MHIWQKQRTPCYLHYRIVNLLTPQDDLVKFALVNSWYDQEDVTAKEDYRREELLPHSALTRHIL